MCVCWGAGWGGALRGTPTDPSNLSFANITVTHHSVFLVIQKGSLAGLSNRGILTFSMKAKVNIRKPSFWAAVTATAPPACVCASTQPGASCTFLTRTEQHDWFPFCR